MTMLTAFHHDPSLKDFVLHQLVQHRETDKLVQGRYWQDGKGCAVGCTLEAVRLRNHAPSIDHEAHNLYESELGVPRALARLEDRIFEGLPNAAAQLWPERFITAIAPGADLAMVVPRFLFWLLDDELPQHVKDKYPKTKAALADVTALYREWIDTDRKPDRDRWVKARAALDDAADADAAYAYAAYAADAYAAYAADAAADAAAYAYAYAYAADAADAYAADADAAAAYAADAYAAYAAYADAADAYAADARRAAYQRHADKLIELLETAPISKAAA